MDTDTIIKRLVLELRLAFRSFPLDEGGHILSTPMYHGDGDGLAVIVKRDDEGWYLTDEGQSTSHLFYDNMDDDDLDGELARKLRVMVEWHGATLDEHCEIRMRVPSSDRDQGPDIAHAVGDFMQIIAQVQGIAVVHWADKEPSRG